MAKIQENVEAEIMQVILEEAQESYKPEIVRVSPCQSHFSSIFSLMQTSSIERSLTEQELPSNTPEDMESNLTMLEQWITSH
jgi:adenylate kinase